MHLESVATSLGGGTTSVVETGMTIGVGDSVVDEAAGIEAGVPLVGGGVSGGSAPEEQADRIRVQKRTAW
jgi:hypothetical protein